VDTPDFGDAFRALAELAPSDITDTLLRLARRVGASEIVAYLIDFSQSALNPVPNRGMPIDARAGVQVRGTVAGQAFAQRKVFAEQNDDGNLQWVPILEGSECTGVLALTVGRERDDRLLSRYEELGLLAGAMIAIAARQTDLFNLVRRRKSMSLPASMQWDLLPPLRIDTPEVSCTGLIEPAYDVGGDCFDHAVNGFTIDVAIMDAMGHGLGSSLTSALAVGSYRHDRREGHPLAVMHENLDTTLSSRFGGEAFVTGQLAQLELRTGELTWVNAGHPRPLLVRDGRVQTALGCRPSLPWGLGGRLAEQAEEILKPGDVVVFYSDGVVEGRSDHDLAFGIDRLIAAIEQAVASQASADLILRQTLNDVMTFQNDHLRDDATIVWLDWDPLEVHRP
jgi:serine phosphatase RsbU (regulator of sigma subunit)